MQTLDFAITGLPRSRTAWCAALFCTESVHCEHEWSAKCDKPEDFLKAIAPGKVSGVADTGVWMLGAMLPVLVKRTVVIHRDRTVCEQSLRARFGVDVDLGWIARSLTAVDGLHIAYDDLDKLETIRLLWEYCTQSPFQHERYAVLKDLRIDSMVDWFGKPLPGRWLETETVRWRQ